MSMSRSLTTVGRLGIRCVLSAVVALVGCGLALVVTAPAPAHAGCGSSADFVFTTTAANTSGYITSIPSSDGLGALPIFVTQLYTSAYDSHPVGVWYDTYSQQWTIFNEDFAAIPIGTSFTVSNFCTPETIALTATASNVQGDAVLINNPATNGNPNASLYATQNWTGTYNPHEIGVYYNIGVGEWAIYNLDLSPMPIGASFDVLPSSYTRGVNANTLSVTASASNTVGGYMVYLNDPRFNNQPALVPALSQVYYVGPCNKFGCPGVINNHPVGVWYDSSAGQWVIYNVDRANMPAGASFFITPYI